MELQPLHLKNNLVTLSPLKYNDFETLFQAASDPLIWEQHPNADRYKRDVFQNYFNGAMESGGAFLIKNTATEEVIGCSRFYDHEPTSKEIKIGYTFFVRSSWGKGFNRATKELMIDYALKSVDAIIFHVGINNFRSRKAMEKLGAEYVGTVEVAYYGEPVKQNVVYKISKPL